MRKFAIPSQLLFQCIILIFALPLSMNAQNTEGNPPSVNFEELRALFPLEEISNTRSPLELLQAGEAILEELTEIEEYINELMESTFLGYLESEKLEIEQRKNELLSTIASTLNPPEFFVYSSALDDAIAYERHVETAVNEPDDLYDYSRPFYPIDIPSSDFAGDVDRAEEFLQSKLAYGLEYADYSHTFRESALLFALGYANDHPQQWLGHYYAGLLSENLLDAYRFSARAYELTPAREEVEELFALASQRVSERLYQAIKEYEQPFLTNAAQQLPIHSFTRGEKETPYTFALKNNHRSLGILLESTADSARGRVVASLMDPAIEAQLEDSIGVLISFGGSLRPRLEEVEQQVADLQNIERVNRILRPIQIGLGIAAAVISGYAIDQGIRGYEEYQNEDRYYEAYVGRLSVRRASQIASVAVPATVFSLGSLPLTIPSLRRLQTLQGERNFLLRMVDLYE